MNRALGVAIVGATTFVSVGAMADTSSVQLIGRIQTELQSTKINGLNNGRTQTSIADNAEQSRFGMRINEDLGNGLAAIAFIDWRFGTGAGTGPFAREQWVGLQGKSWGSATFGRVPAPMKTYGSSAYDLFDSTSLHLAGSGGAMYSPANGFGNGGYVDHAIRYESPKFGIAQFAVLAAPSNADQANALNGGNNTAGRGNGVDLNVAGRFDVGPGEIVAGYSLNRANDAQRALAPVNGRTASNEKVWTLGGRAKFADWAFFGQYYRITDALAPGSTGVLGFSNAGCAGSGNAGGNGDVGNTTGQCNTAMNANGDGNIWFVGTNYKLGNTTLVLQGGRTKANAVGTAPERSAKNVTIGAIHALSKRTTIFGGYQRVNIDSVATVSPGTAPSGTALPAVRVSNPDRKTFSIGMRHNF